MQLNTASAASLFGQAPLSMFPPVSSVVRGNDMDKYEKHPIVVTAYNVDIFDMSKDEDRKRYSELMLDLFKKVQASKCTICKNELQSYNGSWNRYLEWFEFKLNDKSVTDR